MRQSPQQYYGLTIRMHQVKEDVTPHMLDSVIKVLGHLGMETINAGYEAHGVYNQLHAHCVTRGPFIQFQKYSKIGPFRLFWQVLNTKADIHRFQIYTSKYQYETHVFS